MRAPNATARAVCAPYADQVAVFALRDQLAAAGVDTLPLPPHKKLWKRKGWQLLTPADAWAEYQPGGNIAVRNGGAARLVSIDADDDATAGNVRARLLAECGRVVEEHTPGRHGAHFYMHLAAGEDLAGQVTTTSVCYPTDEIGKGEIRHGPGSITTCAPSRTEQGAYQLVAGSMTDLPCVTAAFLLTLITPKQHKGASMPMRSPSAARAATALRGDVPAPAAERVGLERLPERIGRLLTTGKGVERYKSRSEAEAAIIAACARYGYTFEETARLFIDWPGTGRFRERYAASPRQELYQLWRSWAAIGVFVQQTLSPDARQALELAQMVLGVAWPGATGESSRNLLLAALYVAYMGGCLQFALASRDAGLLAGLSWRAAAHGLRRLAGLAVDRDGIPVPVRLGDSCAPLVLDLVRVVKPGGREAPGYRLNPEFVHVLRTQYQRGLRQSDPPESPDTTPPGTMCAIRAQTPDAPAALFGEPPASLAAHDAFAGRAGKYKSTRRRIGDAHFAAGLGKTAAAVWRELRARGPARVSEVAEWTGRGRRSIYNALERMSEIPGRNGQPGLAMVEPAGRGVWRALDVDLAAVATLLGSSGRHADRAASIEWDRDFRRGELAKLAKHGPKAIVRANLTHGLRAVEEQRHGLTSRADLEDSPGAAALMLVEGASCPSCEGELAVVGARAWCGECKAYVELEPVSDVADLSLTVHLAHNQEAVT